MPKKDVALEATTDRMADGRCASIGCKTRIKDRTPHPHADAPSSGKPTRGKTRPGLRLNAGFPAISTEPHSPIDEHRALGQGPPNLEELGMSESAALPSAPHERQHSDCMASEREKSIHSEPLLTPSQARILRQREVAMLQRNVALKAPTPDTRRSY